MRNFLKGALVLALLGPTAALAGAGPGTGITGSAHDMTFNGVSAAATGAAGWGSDQICIYCHSPHKTGTNQPLWNRTTASTAGFTTTTMNGTTLPTTGTLGLGSKRCLSCHDGATAINAVNNAGDGVSGNVGGATVGVMMGTFAPNYSFGTNLDNNHPISLAYSTWQGGFNTEASIASAGVKLYTAAGTWDTTGAAATSTIECASCHEPHNKGAAGANDDFFVRVTMTNSAMCTACHAK